MKNLTLLAIALLAGCGGDDGGTGGGIDAPNTTPTTVTISGTASEIAATGRTPKPGVAIVAFKVADDSMIAMTTTDSSGNFTISATNNGPIDAYLKATVSGLKDTYLYPPAPLSADFTGIPVLMLSQQTQNTAASIAGANPPTAATAWIALIVQDASNVAVADATLTTSPAGEIKYNGSAGLPQAQAMKTAADGIAYSMNVPAGQVTVSAMKSGLTFKSHAINARANVLTLTTITP